MIRKEGKHWLLRTEDGKRILGVHSSYEKALAQEAAVKASEAHRMAAGGDPPPVVDGAGLPTEAALRRAPVPSPVIDLGQAQALAAQAYDAGFHAQDPVLAPVESYPSQVPPPSTLPDLTRALAERDQPPPAPAPSMVGPQFAPPIDPAARLASPQGGPVDLSRAPGVNIQVAPQNAASPRVAPSARAASSTSEVPTAAGAAQGAREYLGHPLQGDISEQERVLQARTAAQEKAGEDLAALYKARAAKAEQDAAAYKASVDEINRRSKEVAQRQLDSGRLWANMSTGSKIWTAIGIALSGLGAGIQGKESEANRMIQDAIKQDLDSQLSDKNSELNQLAQEGMSLKAAYDTMAAAAQEKVKLGVDAIVASTRGADAKERALQLKGELDKDHQAIVTSAANARLAEEEARRVRALAPAQAADVWAGANLKRAQTAATMLQAGAAGQVYKPALRQSPG